MTQFYNNCWTVMLEKMNEQRAQPCQIKVVWIHYVNIIKIKKIKCLCKLAYIVCYEEADNATCYDFISMAFLINFCSEKCSFLNVSKMPW